MKKRGVLRIQAAVPPAGKGATVQGPGEALDQNAPTTMPTMASGMVGAAYEQVGVGCCDGELAFRNLGRKVAMPAAMDDMHTWDRTTSRKDGGGAGSSAAPWGRLLG